ncbi:MAG: hypothetical protein IJ087_09840 [Eggerthellaceae bacterium]|nr:hypothetical protein [Eggerthellaceae bacterium]
MNRAGVYTTEERREAYDSTLAGRWQLDVRTAPACGLVDALESWTAAGIPVAVVDDAALAGLEDESALLGWAATATSASPRLVMVFDGTRDAEDAFLYQLVSTAGVLDLVVTSVGDTMAGTLPARMERPAKLMDVAHWKTMDRRKLKRRGPKGGKAGFTGRLPFFRKGRAPGKGEPDGGRDWEPVLETSEGRSEQGEMETGIANATELAGDESAARAPRASAADLFAGVSPYGAAMRREDGERALASPSAKNIVAVAAASPGIGCTHLSCALALELAGKGVETCCAVYNAATFDAMRRALAPDAERNDEFAFSGVTFYAWGAQRAHAAEYDCVVCDCGLVDYPDDDQDSPASLFRRAGHQAMLVSGAPWLLEDASDAIDARDPGAVSAVTWFTVSAGARVASHVAEAVARSTSRGRAEVHPVPYRPDLMCGDGSRYADYAALLDPVVESARSSKLDPEEFARRSKGRGQLRK